MMDKIHQFIGGIFMALAVPFFMIGLMLFLFGSWWAGLREAMDRIAKNS